LGIGKVSSLLRSSKRVGNIEERICPFEQKDIVLDAGTGLGHLLHELSPRCSQIYAIDTNLDFLKRVRPRIGETNIVLLQADIRRIPFGPSRFTKVICTEVLEHLPEPLPAIEEFHRLLKPGGICVIAVPTRFSERLYSILNQDYSQNQQEHVTILRKNQWTALFRSAGFDITAIRNENFQPALYWIFRNIFPIRYDPQSGLTLENKFTDRVFWFTVSRLNRLTLGGLDKVGKRIFPKSWYFYLVKVK
jgi:ubiquinone/menaquinone biosynthesis C-methylase UbiE